MEILFVTSFSADLYEATGKRLLASFMRHQAPLGHEIVAYYEQPAKGRGICPEEDVRAQDRDGRLHAYDMGNNCFWLQRWLDDNRDVIPDYLGGEAKECQCPGREERHAPHRPRCHWQWMNRNASRWFRKVVAIAEAAKLQPRYLVWVDSDSEFQKPMPVSWVQEKLGKAGLAYFRSHRPAVESGVLLFDLHRGGHDFVGALVGRYLSRQYLQDERWDDGYQIARIIDLGLAPGCRCVDVCKPVTYRGPASAPANRPARAGPAARPKPQQVRAGVKPDPFRKLDNHVMPHTDVWQFLHHSKGEHGARLDIMK